MIEHETPLFPICEITPPEITEFWVQSLNGVQDKGLRGMVLNAFRFYAQTDPRIISLVIGALKDKD